MAWGKVKVEEQKKLFIQEYCKKEFTISALCRQFDISRSTGYEIIKKFQENGLDGLKEQSKRPKTSPNKTKKEIEDRIVAKKLKYKNLGPTKILARLRLEEDPSTLWPSAPTIERILKEHGLVERRKLRRRFAECKEPLSESNDSNDLWSIDFKGWWITRDGKRYEPFTLMDSYSRYVLCCQTLTMNDSKHVWGVFERLFREFGLPNKIRSDNGAPFATAGAGRLSRLSINFIKAGVVPEWIEPGNPQQNGKHERMHLTLKKEAIDPTLDAYDQTKKIEEYLEYYNYIRPHAALDLKSPADLYRPSNKIWNGRLHSPEYSAEFKVSVVHSCGKLMYKGSSVYIGRVFEKEPIGLKEEKGVVEAYYGPIYLGIVNSGCLDFKRIPGRKRY